MARRRTKRAFSDKPAKKKPVTTPVAVGDSSAAMGYPNHGVSPLITWRQPWPLLAVTHRDTDSDSNQPLFIDPRYGEPFHDFPVSDGPPTWMDPMKFVEMVRKNPDVQKILASCYAANDMKSAQRQLPDILNAVFDTEYIPYVIKMFSIALPYVIEWLALNHVAVVLDRENMQETLKHTSTHRRKSGVHLEDETQTRTQGVPTDDDEYDPDEQFDPAD